MVLRESWDCARRTLCAALSQGTCLYEPSTPAANGWKFAPSNPAPDSGARYAKDPAGFFDRDQHVGHGFHRIPVVLSSQLSHPRIRSVTLRADSSRRPTMVASARAPVKHSGEITAAQGNTADGYPD